ALGDFNGDGDKEIVATKFDSVNSRGVIAIFDPVLTSPQPVSLNGVPSTLASGQVFHFVVTGDFMGTGRDQIVAGYDASDGEHLIEYYPTNAAATQWAVQDLGTFSLFGAAWDVVTSGDVNGDGRAELVLARNIDKDLLILTGQKDPSGPTSIWAQLWESNGFCSDCNWKSLAVGRVFNDPGIPGNQLVIDRQSSFSGRNSTLIFNWDGTNMNDITPGNSGDYYFNPNFSEMALAKLDGTASPYSEIIELRQVPALNAPQAFMAMLNLAGAGLPAFEVSGDYDADSWTQIAAGDLLAIGRDAVVTMRPNTLRVYDQPWSSAHFLADVTGSFYAPGNLPNVTTLAVGRIGFSNLGPTISTNALTFFHEIGASASTEMLTARVTIQGPGSGSQAFAWAATASPHPAWLNFSPTTGTTTAQGSIVQVTVDPAQVPNTTGTYSAVIVINPTNPFRSDWVRSVTVTFVVTPHVHRLALPVVAR
ncbi:MAG TPA: hypothetical protein VGA61_15400, partial [Anaerolineae bacterium]